MLDVNLKQKALYGVLWSFFDKLITQAGSFILLIYLSRILSPSDFGLIAMLAIFLAIAQSLIDSGFSQALIQKSHKATETDFSTVFYVNLMVSVLLYIVLYLAAPCIADFYNQPELIDLSRVLFLIFFLNAFSLVPGAKLSIKIDFKAQGLISSVAMVVSAAVTIYLMNGDYGYWTLVGMYLSRAVTSTLLLLIISKWRPRWQFSITSLKSLFAFSSNLLIAGLVSVIVNNLYSVLIGRYYNAIKLGYFQRAFNFTNIISGILTSVLQGVTYPVMTTIQEDKERLVQMYIKVMGVVALASFPVFVGLAAISEEFVLIFLGEKWRPIIPIVIILSLARLITPMSSLNLNILNARGRSDLYLKTDLRQIPMAIAALFIAVPHGILGVAIAQLITTFISFFINTYYPGKLFGFGAKEQLKKIFPIVIASVIMYLSIIFIEVDNLILQMLIKIIVGFIVYIAFCRIFKVAALMDSLNLIRNVSNKQG